MNTLIEIDPIVNEISLIGWESPKEIDNTARMILLNHIELSHDSIKRNFANTDLFEKYLKVIIDRCLLKYGYRNKTMEAV